MEKQPFLVCYDYDPELDVVYERPSFMSEGMYQDIVDRESHEIDGQPWGV